MHQLNLTLARGGLDRSSNYPRFTLCDKNKQQERGAEGWGGWVPNSLTAGSITYFSQEGRNIHHWRGGPSGGEPVEVLHSNDPVLMLFGEIVALAYDGTPGSLLWAESHKGIPGLAVQTVARASGYKISVVERRARQFQRGIFWFTRTVTKEVSRAPVDFEMCFVTPTGLAAIFAHLQPHHFKEPIKRYQAERLRELSYKSATPGSNSSSSYLTRDWQEVKPLLRTLSGGPVLSYGRDGFRPTE